MEMARRRLRSSGPNGSVPNTSLVGDSAPLWFSGTQFHLRSQSIPTRQLLSLYRLCTGHYHERQVKFSILAQTYLRAFSLTFCDKLHQCRLLFTICEEEFFDGRTLVLTGMTICTV